MPAKKSKGLASYNRNLTPREFKLVVAFLLAVGSFLFYTLVTNNKSYFPTYYQPTSQAVVLKELNKSGESGNAVLTENGGKTTVVLTLSGSPKGVAQPAHIHVGSCPNPGAVKYALNNVVGGSSVTVLPVTLSQLKSQLPLAVNVHKSVSLAKTYVSCGNLK